MRYRLGSAANDELLKVRLLQRLPEKVAFTLSAFMDRSVDEIAKMAESMLAHEPSSLLAAVADKRRPMRPKADEPELCWYHSRFGPKARKCRPPCQWSGNETANRQ